MPRFALTLFAGLAASLALVACKVDVDLSDTQFSCSDGVTCPSGTSCVDGLCLAPMAEGDADLSEPADAGAADAALTCDDVFGAAPEYELCAEQPGSCRFSTRTDGGTCRDVCQQFGAECLMAYDNDDPPCEVQLAEPPDTCDTPRMTEICVCSMP